MKDFDTIVKPLLEIKYRVKNIEIGKPPVRRTGNRSKLVVTPAGTFLGAPLAARQTGISLSLLYKLFKTNPKEYYAKNT